MTHARTTDPATSHEAAASVSGVTDKRHACLLAVQAIAPCTDEDLWAYYSSTAAQRGWPMQSPSGLRTRRAELVRDGSLRDSGMRSRTPAGRRCIVWERAGG